MDRTSQALRAAFDGDLQAVYDLKQYEHEELVRAGNRLGDLTLTRDAVGRVLEALRRHEVRPSTVQAWASFVRRGYIAVGSGPIRPLDIALIQITKTTSSRSSRDWTRSEM